MIKQAKRVRKAFGGGMRQAGYLAAAGIYALDHHIDRLKEDHRRARKIGEALSKAEFVESVQPVDTNIIIFTVREDVSVSETMSALEDKGVRAVPFGPRDIRMVTHMEFDDAQLEQLTGILKELTIRV
jgi:threonine aldolase